MCKVQQVNIEGNRNAAADCSAFVIDTVWGVCQVKSEGRSVAIEEQPAQTTFGDQRYSFGKSLGKGSVCAIDSRTWRKMMRMRGMRKKKMENWQALQGIVLGSLKWRRG